MVSKERIEQAKRVPLEIIAFSTSQEARYNQYFCPNCGKYKLTFYTEKNTFSCYSCNTKGSALDYYCMITGKDFRAAIDDLTTGELSSTTSNEFIKTYRKEQAEKQHQKDLEKQQEFQEMLSSCINMDNVCYNYFSRRGISKEILNRIPKDILDIKCIKHKNLTNIVYHFKKGNFAICKGVNKINDKRFVRNFLHSKPSIIRVYSNNTYYICEGIEDALSLIELGYNAICLNSASNVDQFQKLLLNSIDWSKKQKFIIALDNDPAGYTAAETLENFFKGNSLEYDFFTEYMETALENNLKDINDFLLYYKCKQNLKMG